MNTAVFIYGLPGAGKSTVLSVADELDIPSVTMGDVVRKRAKDALGDDLDSNDIGEWATAERDRHGEHIMAEYTREEILNEYPNAPIVIVEGTRSPDEIALFESDFRIVTIRVSATFENRLERLRSRGRDGEDTFTEADLENRDERERNWGLAELYDQDDPDHVIDNNGSIHGARTRIRYVLQLIQIRHGNTR